MSRPAFLRRSDITRIERANAAELDAMALRLLPTWRAWCAEWSLVRADLRAEPLVQGAGRVASVDGWKVAGRWHAPGDPSVDGPLVRESGVAGLVKAAMDLPAQTAWPEDSLAASLAASIEVSWRAWCASWLGELAPAVDAATSDAMTPADLGELVLRFSCMRPNGDTDGTPVECCLRLAASVLMEGRTGDARGQPLAAAQRTLPPLSPLTGAIAHLPVRVQVHLSQASLEMGQLMDLQPGDVIPLPHSLAQPARLHLLAPCDTPIDAEARLGRDGPHWAVRVDPIAARSE